MTERLPGEKHGLFIFNCARSFLDNCLRSKVLDKTFLITRIEEVNLRKAPRHFFHC